MFKLPENLDIYKIEKVQGELLEYIEEQFNKEEALILDATNTKDIDAAGVQLLLAISKLASKEKINMQIKNKQKSLRKLLLISGVEQFLGSDG